MASSGLERTRLIHQDVEQLTLALVEDIVKPPKTHKEKVFQEHRIKDRIDGIQKAQNELLQLYEDLDGSRKEELDGMTGEQFTEFYERLKGIREYHRKFPNAGIKIDDAADAKPKVKFTGEEMFGKHVDMHDLFARALNFVWLGMRENQVDYTKYLQSFHQFDSIPKAEKLKPGHREPYEKYLEDLLGYLINYYARVHPLNDPKELLAMIEEDLNARWAKKAVSGWFAEGGEDADAAPLQAKQQNVLYCIACDKTFAKLSVYEGHLPGKKHKKAQAKLDAAGSDQARETARLALKDRTQKGIAMLEAKISNFAELLKDRLMDTISFIEKKQTKTVEEIQAELEEESGEEEPESEDEEVEKPIYNPLNLPLGWDGKPIPYWLYKLHGLNIEYKCEICDYSYWGPRNFDRHFKQWRHVYGLRCMGIPNTVHYHNITKMADALALHRKLQTTDRGGWVAADGEEFEDNDGNVFNRKTYEDLKRQGLID